MLYADDGVWKRAQELIAKAIEGDLTLEETKELRIKANSVSVGCSNSIKDLTGLDSEV